MHVHTVLGVTLAMNLLPWEACGPSHGDEERRRPHTPVPIRLSSPEQNSRTPTLSWKTALREDFQRTRDFPWHDPSESELAGGMTAL